MLVIWKYEVNYKGSEGKFVLSLPIGAEILNWGKQHDQAERVDKIYCWALVDPEQPKKEDHEFYLTATGEMLENFEYMHYVDTIHDVAGWLVFHVFKKEPWVRKLPEIYPK